MIYPPTFNEVSLNLHMYIQECRVPAVSLPISNKLIKPMNWNTFTRDAFAYRLTTFVSVLQ